MPSSRSAVPNQEAFSNGVLVKGEAGSYTVSAEEEDSMVKSQYGTVSFGFTACRLYSNVLVRTEWLTKKPRPS